MAGVFYFPLLGTPTAEGNQLWFYEAGLDVPLDVWTDSDLTIPWVQPIVFNATGNPDGPIYVSPAPAYKVVYQDADDVPIPGYPVDFVSPSTIINVTTTSITTLTNAQIKLLPTTPVELIAAPDSSDVRIKVLGATIVVDAAAGSYTNINATYADVHLQWSSGEWPATPIFNDVTATPDVTGVNFLLAGGLVEADLLIPYVVAFPSYANVTAIATTGSAGLALQIGMDNNGSGVLTGGNAANTMTVTVYYAIESLN